MQIGRHSRKLTQIRKALRHGTLTDDGLLPIEGPVLLEEARRSAIEIADVLFRSGTPVPSGISCRVHEVPPDLFETIQETEHSQGLVATIRPRRFTLEDVLRAGPALVIVLARLQDPGNVGTCLRVAEAFGATGCVALTGTAGFYNSKVVRASAGSLFRLPHVAGVEIEDLAGALHAKNIRIVGTAPHSESSIEGWDWRQAAAILIGNEGAGLNAHELGYCDTVLRIPHSRMVESLNSAIAAAIIMYEAWKQRR
jgi:TrmH family RNA methyltransferase